MCHRPRLSVLHNRRLRGCIPVAVPAAGTSAVLARLASVMW